MKVRISALIIDKDKDQHDYSLVQLPENSLYRNAVSEGGFDLAVYTDCNNALAKIKESSIVDCIITIGDVNCNEFNALPFEYRKRWIHLDEFDPTEIAYDIIGVFSNNINRVNPDEFKLFSIFTCTFNTPLKIFQRLYKSLRNQTYNNWNWFILDDSTDDRISEYVKNLEDPRIKMVRNITDHGVIGFNKHLIASMCDGDYLVEVDHDDELTTNCLELLNKAFAVYPDTDFVYSYAMELYGDSPVNYGDSFAYGLGEYGNFLVGGKFYKHIALTPNVNALSVRGIYALPNHVRCWKSGFYHKIGGHNKELSVMDDMDLLVRTFLHGKMTLVPTVLYIQHEGEENTTDRDRSKQNTAQGRRFAEIQRMNTILQLKYNIDIHNRVLELGGEDPFWTSENEPCDVHRPYDKAALVNFNHVLEL